MKRKKNLKKLLNMNFIDYTNLTPKCGEFDMPFIKCTKIPKVDYLATYSQPSTYFKTENTAVCFFEYDLLFDGLYGLWNAIYYGVEELQEEYVKRFQGVKVFIAPDYSKLGDSCEIENKHRQFRSRIVGIWLSVNLHAIVVPLVSVANRSGMKTMLDGMQKCTVVAFNAKGAMGDAGQLPIFMDSIRYAVDNLPELQEIIVYSASPNKEKVLQVFEYAINKGISIQIPDNMLQSRNRLRGGE